jgi:hypothetical protein
MPHPLLSHGAQVSHAYVSIGQVGAPLERRTTAVGRGRAGRRRVGDSRPYAETMFAWTASSAIIRLSAKSCQRFGVRAVDLGLGGVGPHTLGSNQLIVKPRKQ